METQYAIDYYSHMAPRASVCLLVAALIAPLAALVRWAYSRDMDSLDMVAVVTLGALSPTFTIAAVFCRWRRTRTAQGILMCEAVTTLSVLVALCSLPFLDRYYCGKLIGFQGRDSFGPGSNDDLLLPGIVLAATLSQTAFPLRAHALMPIDVVGLLLYAALVFLIGSPKGPTRAGLSLVLLTCILASISAQRWTCERLRRSAFAASWVDPLVAVPTPEGNKRAVETIQKMLPSKQDKQKEQPSETLQARASSSSDSRKHSRQRKYSANGISETTLNKAADLLESSPSLAAVPQQSPAEHAADESINPATTDSAGLFKDVSNNWTKIAELGKREKWLIDESELKMQDEVIMGQGAFGVVVGAFLHGTPVALKLPRQQSTRNQMKGLSQIGNELRILRQVRHPNIVLFHGACVDFENGELVLVLELVQGMRMDTYIMRFNSVPGDHSDSNELLNISGILERYVVLLGIIRALRYLHVQKPHIIHGDLKAVNIVVQNPEAVPTPKLLDFGLSRCITQNAKIAGGTLAWMAPEVIRQQRCPPKPVQDVFSMGRLIYFVTTGMFPMMSISRQAIIRLAKAMQQSPLLWPDNVPLASLAQPLAERCVNMDPAARPPTDEVYDEMASWADNLPPEIPQGLALKLQAQVRLSATAPAPEDESDEVSPVRPIPSLEQSAPAASSQERTSLQERMLRARSAAFKEEHDRQLEVLAHPHEMRPMPPLMEGNTTNMTEDMVLVHPELLETPRSTQIILLLSTMLQLNFAMPRNTCCRLHAAARIMTSITRELSTLPCSQAFHTPVGKAVQCPRCSLVEMMSNTAAEEGFKCDLCGMQQDANMSMLSSAIGYQQGCPARTVPL